MKNNINAFNAYSEYRLIQKIDRLEVMLYKLKQSFIKWGISLAFVIVILEIFFIHYFIN